MTMISLFSKASDIKNGKDIPFDIFLDNIKEGAWQDMVLPIRAISDKAKRDEAKKRVPYVTISGKFRERTDAGLITHSGFIGIDIDDVDPEEVKSIICPDHYIYAAFTSIGGRGVCAVFKINGDKHRDAFAAIGEYLMDKYQLVIDPTSVNPSRARFISYDPHIYVNQAADKFTAISKRKPDKKVPEVIYVQTDFDLIIQEIVSRRIDITGDYHTWLRIGFALADKFGEGGRNYFHQVSQIAPSYNPRVTDKQFTNCLKARKSGITIASFYYLAKQAGITTVSPQTKLISTTAHFAKKGARTKESAITYLQEAEGIAPAVSAPIVEQVFENNIHVDTKESPIEAIEMWIRQNYDLRRNVITRYIENKGKQLQAKDFNTIYVAAAKVFEKCSYELIDRIINSDFTIDFNPLQEFFITHQARKPKGIIRAFWDTIESDTGLCHGEFFPDYKFHFGTKWLVGIVSAIHGRHSPLMMVLSGNKQNTGKTEFWRRFLPRELRTYYAESKLDAGKDDEILMTQKVVIMDDEMGGKSKSETKRLKELTSKQTFSLREPYGRNNVDLERLAVLCGTTNDNEILNDPTGNRRLIPVNVISINHAAYNAIDKTDLIMEAYWLWKDGYTWELSSKDIEILNENTGYFEQTSAEYDLLSRYYEFPNKDIPVSQLMFRTPTEIKSKLEKESMQKLNQTRLGMEMKRVGFEKIEKRFNGQKIKGYYVWEKGNSFVPGGDSTSPSIFQSAGDG
jgi:predicted P-loop ATPase